MLPSGKKGEMVITSPTIGVKRPAPTPESAAGRKRKQTKDAVTTVEEKEDWVPLDEFYYGKKEGDPAYREEKGEFRFKV